MDLETRTIRRITKRLVPFLILCYFIAYLDRVNVGFAALTMNKDLGLSSWAFGLGSGIFFIAYFFFEVPSNLLLERFGASRWIARIMFTWGLLSGAMGFIPQISRATGVSPEHTFYGIRILLGMAEAGFFPGIIFYLTLWFPAVYRARIIGMFMAAIPLSTVIGAPISGLLFELDGVAGLAGWQWLFVVEALPALLMSVAVFFYLTDTPAAARWLPDDERTWLVNRQAQERRQREAAAHFSVMQALLNPRVLALSLVYFGCVATNYGLGFFLPQIVNAFGTLSKIEVTCITALPFVVGVFSIVLWGRRSDRLQERRWHTAIPLFVAASGIAVSTLLPDPVLKMVALSVAGFGIFGSLPVFWTLPTAFLSGAAAAGGIAIINSIGNLAGFAGPYAMGAIKDATGSFNGGLLCLAAFGMLGMVIVLALGHDHSLEQAPEGQVSAAE